MVASEQSSRRLPVIVGIGQVTHRDETPIEPVDLLAAAARQALDDARVPGTDLASVDVINVVSWLYDNVAGRLAERLGRTSARLAESAPGGDQPTRLLAAAGRRAVEGGGIHLVVGGEAMRSVGRALVSGAAAGWTPPPPGASPANPRDFVTEEAYRHGLVWPTAVYPLFEHGLRHALGHSRADALEWSSVLWSQLSAVAADNPGSWFRGAVSAERIGMADEANRMIYDPYPKLMNALLTVDQAAAVVVTDDETAYRLGVPEGNWVYLWNGSGAHDTSDVLARVGYHRSPAMERTLDDALTVAVGDRDRSLLSFIELYSCFPCVPKLALTHLGWVEEKSISITGGLTFFGGPANAYMLCATTAMVDALRRSDDDRPALLYGQGEFVTKHHALVIGRRPRPQGPLPPDDEPARQSAVDALASPPQVVAPSGSATVETFTVEYARDGAPIDAIVVGRLDSGARFIARDDDRDDVAALLHDDHEPIGWPGTVTPAGDEPNRFQLA